MSQIHPVAPRKVYGTIMPVIHCGSSKYLSTVAVNIAELERFIEKGGIVAVARTKEFEFFTPAIDLLKLAIDARRSGKEYGVVERLLIPVFQPGHPVGPEAKPAVALAGVLGENPEHFYNPTLRRLLDVCRQKGVTKLTVDLKNNRFEIA